MANISHFSEEFQTASRSERRPGDEPDDVVVLDYLPAAGVTRTGINKKVSLNGTTMFIDDVPRRFSEVQPRVRGWWPLSSKERYLGARNTRIPKKNYRLNLITAITERLGFGSGSSPSSGKSHFQGIQRIGQRLVLSTALSSDPIESQLIVITMGSQSNAGPWSIPKYGHDYKNPPKTDVTTEVFAIDGERWHGGGIQAVDDVVAIPIYGGGPGSEIRFVRVTDSGVDPIPSATLVKPDIASKAVAFARLNPTNSNGQFLLVIWDDLILDFHLSVSDDIEQGFHDRVARVDFDEAGGIFKFGPSFLNATYQNINLLVGTDGGVYLLGSGNASRISPGFLASDWLDLYRLVGVPEFTTEPKLEPVDSKQMYCNDQQCSFGAAAGVYVPDETHLWIYAAAHHLHGKGNRINFNEYSHLLTSN